MKKRIEVILLVVVLMSISAVRTFGQVTYSSGWFQPRFTIGLTGGGSFPMGNFATARYSDPASGFAGPGYNAGVSGTWLLKGHFGVSFVVSMHQFGFTGAQQMVEGYKESFSVDSATFYSKGTNHSFNFLLGPYYSYPISKRLSVDARLVCGLVYASLAGNRVFMEDQMEGTFAQKQSTIAALGTQAGLGLAYRLSPHLRLSVNADYFYSKPDFTIINDNRNNTAGRLLTRYTEPVAGINTNITVACLMAGR